MKRAPKKEVDDFFSPDFDIESRIIDPFVDSVGGKRVEKYFAVPNGWLRSLEIIFRRGAGLVQ